MKIFLSVFLTLALLTPALAPTAQAVFPGKSVAHWDLTESEDRNDPEYDRLHNLVREKKYDEAMKIAEEKIRTSPKDGTPVILKALLLNEMGRYKEALNHLMTGQHLELRHPALHYGFCQVYRNLGEVDLSQRGCLIAVEQHYNTPETHYELAQTMAALGNMERANKELELADQLDAGNALYSYERGMNFNYLNLPEMAEQAFLKALAIDADHIDANYQLAYLYATQGKTDSAKQHIMRVLETRREHPKLKSANLLLEYVNKNALDQLPRKIVPHQYHVGRSRSLYQSQKYGLALIEIQTAARLKSDDLKIQEILIGLCSILTRLPLGEKTVNHFIELTNGADLVQAKGYQELGDIRVLQGNLDEARGYYEKARDLGDPNNLAEITLSEFPEDSRSIPPLLNPGELFIEPPEAMNRKGEIFAHYGMNNRAIAIYSMVIRMDPNHLMAMLNIATAHYHKGAHHRAISILERLLVTHPNHEHILAHRLLLARAYMKKGDVADGLKNLEVAVRMNPSVKEVIKSDPVFDDLKQTEAFKQLIE